jgi:hypothetical protein
MHQLGRVEGPRVGHRGVDRLGGIRMNHTDAGSAAGVLSLIIAIAFGAVRVYYYFKKRKREDTTDEEKQKDEQSKQRRRDAADEAWQVADRLQAVLTGYDQKFSRLEAEYRKAIESAKQETQEAREGEADCERRLARLEGRVEVIEAWARDKKLNLPPASGPSSGSGNHRLEGG